MARPKRHDPEELRRMVLDAARAIIDEHGPESLTARDLARAIGYTPGTIYNLFDSLPAVLYEVNRETFAGLAGLFQEIPADLGPAERLQWLAGAYVDFMQDNQALWRGLFEGPRRTEVFPQWYVDTIRALLARIAGMIGDISPDLSDAQAMAEAERLYVNIHGILSLAANGRLDLVTDQPGHYLAQDTVRRAITALRVRDGDETGA